MRTATKIFTIILVVTSTMVLTSWDIWENAKKKIKGFTEEVLNDKPNDLITAKLDTLEATVNIFNKPRSIRLSNQKFAELANLHLRIALELHECVGEGGGTEEQFLKYNLMTLHWIGGHPHNRNWVSGYLKYDEARDYEYTDYRFQFDESNPLPTAYSKAEDIMDGLLK